MFILFVCLPHFSLRVTNAIMALKVTPASEQPMPATIDIPDLAPWTVLDGDANTQNYGWRQPHFTMPSYLGADSTRTLIQYLRIPIYPWVYYFRTPSFWHRPADEF